MGMSGGIDPINATMITTICNQALSNPRGLRQLLNACSDSYQDQVANPASHTVPARTLCGTMCLSHMTPLSRYTLLLPVSGVRCHVIHVHQQPLADCQNVSGMWFVRSVP